MVRALHSLALAIGLTLTAASADEKPTPASRLKAIQKEVAAAEAAFREAWAKLPDPEQEDPTVEKLFKMFDEKQQAGFAVALEIAKADPKSDAGFDALEWLLMALPASGAPAGKPALELMLEHHVANPKIGKAIAVLATHPPDDRDPTYRPAVDLIKAVVERNPDRTARGQAALGVAKLAKRAFEWADSRANPDAGRLASEAENAFEAVIRDYGDCRNLRGKGGWPAATLEAEVKPALYELRYLGVGKQAPDIEAEDLSGAKFKLSSYRGKVVLLVFWASWCGSCMADVPHERELVEHFKGRPFVLVGVNGDANKQSAQKAVDNKQILWRSFWNGRNGPVGPIAIAWNVRSWPTIYLLDDKGVIRYKYLSGKRLDDLLEKLVAEVEAGSKEGAR